MTGRDTIDFLKEIVKEVKIPVAAAGGIDVSSGAEAIANGAAIVIVGGSIVRSANVTVSASKIREAIDNAQMNTAPRNEPGGGDNQLFSERYLTPNVSDAMHSKGAMRDILPINLGVK